MNPRFQHTHEPAVFRLDARAVVDGEGVVAAPGSVVVRLDSGNATVLAAGTPLAVDTLPAVRDAFRIDLPRAVLLPGFVNAHTHLDLTHIGPRGFDPAAGFHTWLAMILRERATTPEAIAASVRQGVALSLAGGVVAVGDISGAGRVEPAVTLRESPLRGVSYIEFFGMGAAQERALARAAEVLETLRARTGERVRIGVSPHAPYTVGTRLYAGLASLCASVRAPIATHLAESVEEREFIATGAGPMRELLERFGLWSDAAASEVGEGQHPIEHLAPALRRTPFLLAHVNDCPVEMLPILAATCASVAWCPRGWTYFGRDETVGPHNWRAMLRAGVNVALGTDSIVNIPPDSAGRISTLDEARRLHATEDADGATLLRMITTNGARALGMDESLFTFAPGPIAGVVAVEVEGGGAADPIDAVMRCDAAPELLLIDGAVGARLGRAVRR